MSHPIVPVVIEHGIPYPVKSSQADVYREAFPIMKAGDSFTVPTEGTRQIALTTAKELGVAVRSARTEPKGKTWRIWVVSHESTKPLAAKKEPAKVREVIGADNAGIAKVDARRAAPVIAKEVAGTEAISRVTPSPGKPGQFDITPAKSRPSSKPSKVDPEEDDSEEGEFFMRDTAQSIHEKWQLGLITDAEVDLRQERLESIEAGDIETQQRIEHQLIEMHG